jgi:preprotein translocase subunit SecD
MASWVGALRLQAIITGIVCASAVALAAPGSGAEAGEREPPPNSEVSRGGGIARGIAFVLAPEWDVVHRNALRRIRDDVAMALRADGIRHDNLRISGGTIRLRISEPSALGRARASIARAARDSNLTAAASMPGLAVQASPGGELGVQLTGFGLAALQDGFLVAARRALERRLSGNGFGDYLLTDDGDRIRVEIPPMAVPARADRQC